MVRKSGGEIEDLSLEEWRLRLRCWAGASLPVSALGRVLYDALRRLPSPLGRYVCGTSLGDSPNRRRALLPLPIEVFVKVGAHDHCEPGAWSEDLECWYRTVGHTLNYLGSAFGKVDRACAPPREASSRQLAAMKHLSSILKWFLSSDDASPPPFEKVFKEGSEKKYTYEGAHVTNRRGLLADKVIPTWPMRE